jgi:hypothetical protein
MPADCDRGRVLLFQQDVTGIFVLRIEGAGAPCCQSLLRVPWNRIAQGPLGGTLIDGNSRRHLLDTQLRETAPEVVPLWKTGLLRPKRHQIWFEYVKTAPVTRLTYPANLEFMMTEQHSRFS